MSLEPGVIVIVNPVSGNGGSNALLEGVKGRREALVKLSERCAGGDPSQWPVVHTTKDDSWRNSVEAFIKTRGMRTVVAIGGDGTLMEVAALLHGLKQGSTLPADEARKLSLVAVPGGRGNDFARTLYGYTRDDGDFWSWVERAVTSERKRWQPQELDLASANGKLFLNMASIGYGGRVVENAQNRKALWSKTSLVYQVEGAIELTAGHSSSCDVKVDGESVYTGPFFGAFVGNGKANGSGLYWTRNARLDDGKIDGIVFPKPGLLETLRTMSAIKAQKAPCMTCSEFQGAEITFFFDRPTALELDGDFIGNAMQHGFKCLPRALNTWVLKK